VIACNSQVLPSGSLNAAAGRLGDLFAFDVTWPCRRAPPVATPDRSPNCTPTWIALPDTAPADQAGADRAGGWPAGGRHGRPSWAGVSIGSLALAG
jgi:hypothetical protein